MRIAVGSDQEHPVVERVVGTLKELGHDVINVDASQGSWVDVGTDVGTMVSSGQARLGVVCCWTGTGVSIAANKVDGVRAALCHDEFTAEGARLYNHANVLALGLACLDPDAAEKVLRKWLATPTGGGEHRANIERLR